MTSPLRVPILMPMFLGTVAWLLGPWIAVGVPPAYGSVEHTFAATPLIVMPVALGLLATMVGPSPTLCTARRSQTPASVLLLLSLSLGHGFVAPALAIPWLVVSSLVAIAIASDLRRRPRLGSASIGLFAAALFLPLGAVALLLSRLGLHPAALTTTKVLLAATHFHFSGFVLQVLMAAADRHTRPRRWSRVVPGSSIAAIVAIAFIAAGNVTVSPLVKAVGVAIMVATMLCFVAVTAVVAYAGPRDRGRRLLAVSAASGALAMLLAGAFGIAELGGRPWLGIPTMVVTHGFLQVFGFGLCGLWGHLCRGGADAAVSESGGMLAAAACTGCTTRPFASRRWTAHPRND